MDSVIEVLRAKIINLHDKLSRGLDEDAIELIVTALQSANIDLIQWRTDWENVPMDGSPVLLTEGKKYYPFVGHWGYVGRFTSSPKMWIGHKHGAMGHGSLAAFAILPSGGE